MKFFYYLFTDKTRTIKNLKNNKSVLLADSN